MMGHLYTDKYVSILLRGYRMHLYYKIHERVKRRILLSTYLFFSVVVFNHMLERYTTYLLGCKVVMYVFSRIIFSMLENM